MDTWLIITRYGERIKVHGDLELEKYLRHLIVTTIGLDDILRIERMEK